MPVPELLGITHSYPTGYPTVGSCASVLFRSCSRGVSRVSYCISRINIIESVQAVSANAPLPCGSRAH